MPEQKPWTKKEFKRVSDAGHQIQSRYSDIDPRVKQAKLGLKASLAHAEGMKRQAGAAKFGHKIQAVKTGMGIFNLVKPFIVGLLIIMFLIGPGLTMVTQLLGSLNPWMWGGIILIAILIWRNQ